MVKDQGNFPQALPVHLSPDLCHPLLSQPLASLDWRPATPFEATELYGGPLCCAQMACRRRDHTHASSLSTGGVRIQRPGPLQGKARAAELPSEDMAAVVA